MQILPQTADLYSAPEGSASGTNPMEEGLVKAKDTAKTSSFGAFAALFQKIASGATAAKEATKNATTASQQAQAMASEHQALAQEFNAGVRQLKGHRAASLRDLALTTEDLASVRQALLDFGVAEKDLQEMAGNMTRKGAVRWSDLLRQVELAAARLAGQEPNVAMSAGDKSRLLTLFQKMGCSNQEAEGLVGDLGRGRSEKVLAALQKKLAGQSGDTSLSLDPADLNAMASAVRLSSAASAELQKIVGQAGRTEFTVAEARAAMTALAAGAASQDALKNAAAQELKAMLAQRLDLAAERAARERDSAASSKKVIDASKDKAAARKMVVGDQAEDQSASRQHGLHHAHMREAAEAGIKDQAKEQNADLAQHRAEARRPHQPQAEGALAGAEKSNAKGNNAEREWDRFWERITRKLVEADPRAALGGLRESFEAAAQTRNAPVAAQEKFAAADILRQVESGILRNLSEGRKQLTLQLEPQDLGTLNVVLTVRGKEVAAVIHTENAETTRALGEQMHQLRQTLEAQGLKVAELDVQTGLPQDTTSRQWSGTAEHNRQSEQEFQAREQARMRQLRSLARNENDAVAVADTTQPWTRPAATGLDLFA